MIISIFVEIWKRLTLSTPSPLWHKKTGWIPIDCWSRPERTADRRARSLRRLAFRPILFPFISTDYAKWMLDDPRVNFAISSRGRTPGLDHLGIQAEDQAELREVYGRLHQAGRPVLEEGETTCCYAHSEKSWVEDPAGISWETFLTR